MIFTKLFTRLNAELNPTIPQYFNNWQSAQNQCDGYGNTAILESIVKASKAVSKGDALYERDGVTFRHFAENAHLVSALKHIVATKGHFQVLDFGGALGSIYRQHRWFLSDFTEFIWCVVEQNHFAETGKRMFENNKLKFETSISTAFNQYKPNIAVISNALQRLERPYDVLNDLVNQDIPYLFIDRLPVISEPENRIIRSVFPARSCHASYPSWLFSESEFKKSLLKNYRIREEFDASDKNDVLSHNTRYIGLFCEKI